MMCSPANASLAVVPILVGPLQMLLAILPGIIVAVLGGLVPIFKPSAIKTTARLVWRLKVQVAAVACCVAAVGWAAGRYWPSFGPSANTAQAGGDWPMFRRSLARRGCVPGDGAPSGGEINWVHKIGGESFFSSPAIVGNRVYVASASLKAYSSGSGKIYCFDADTGAQVWTSAPSGYRPTFSSPVISGHRLVCGEGMHVTDDARIICLDIRPEAEGRVLWTFRTDSHVECTPVIADGRVFIGAGDDGFYCLDLDSGREIWHSDGRHYPDAETSLAVYDGKLYAGLGLGGRALCVLDAKTGRQLRRIPTPQAVFGPPAVHVDDDGVAKLYIGMGAGDYANSAEVAARKEIAKRRKRLKTEGKSAADIAAAVARAQRELAPGGQVWCVDMKDLSADGAGEKFRPDWTFKLPRTALGAVAVVADEVYFASRDGGVYCLDRKTGAQIARTDLHEPIKASVAVADELVYVMTPTGTLYGLTRPALEPAWEIKLGSAQTVGQVEAMCISSPAVARGRLYVGTQREGFLCVGRPGRRGPPVWPGRLGGPGRGGNLDASPLPAAGKQAWQWPLSDKEAERRIEAGQMTEKLVRAPPAAPPGRLLVPVATGQAPGLVCLPIDGEGAGKPAPLWTRAIGAGVWTSPAVVGDRVFVVDGPPDGGRRQLHCLGIDDGRRLWQAGVAPGASGVMQASARFLVIQDKPGQLTWYGLSGSRQRSIHVGTLDCAPTVTASLVVAATSDPVGLTVFDAPTGIVLWRRKLPSPVTTSPAVGRATLFVGTQEAMEARRLTDGELVWRAPVGARGDIALGRRHVVYVSTNGELVAANRANGRIVARHKGVTPGSSLLMSRGRVIFETLIVPGEGMEPERNIMVIDLNTPAGEPKAAKWLEDTSWLGKPATAMVLSGSKVYMGRGGLGLVCLTAN